MVDRVNPDIIIDTESWLQASIQDTECFPVDEQGELIYHVERTDREKLNHKGYSIKTKKDLNIKRVTTLETDC